MMVNYFRVWFPASLAVHCVLFMVLLRLPSPFSTSDQVFISVDTVTDNPAKKPAESPAKPTRTHQPQPLAREVVQPRLLPRRLMTAQLPGQHFQPAPIRTIDPLHPQAASLTPTGGMPGSPRNPLERPGGGTGFANGMANLPGVPLDTPQPRHGRWADDMGAGGNPGAGLSGPGKLSPLPPGGGSSVNLPGVIGNAGALRPGPASAAYAGRGGGAGGGTGGTFSPTGGGGITLSDGGMGNLPGSAPSLHDQQQRQLGGQARPRWPGWQRSCRWSRPCRKRAGPWTRAEVKAAAAPRWSARSGMAPA